MVEPTAGTRQDKKRRTLTDLLLLLALLPVILGSLLCAGQLALFFGPRFNAVDTSSRISASYLPWPYDLIPAINLPALIEDLERDERAMGNPIEPTVVVRGTFWSPPTPTATVEDQTLETPIIFPTLTLTAAPQPTQTPLSTATQLNIQPTASRTPTTGVTIIPTLSSTPTRTPTNTFVIPSATNTQAPPPPATQTFTATATRRPPPTSTHTSTPTTTPTSTLTNTPAPPPTNTFTPTPETVTPPTDTPVPTYAPVVPYAENGGASEAIPGGCRAYFAYWNQNPQPVTIPIGSRNLIYDENISVSPAQPTYFLVGHIHAAFSVDWFSGEPLVWTLDGRHASANWCTSP